MIRAEQRKMYRYLVVLTIASTLGLESWLTLFNNFAVEVVALKGNHVGLIQSVREIPGFLAFLVVYFLLVVKEHRLSALAIIVLGLGMAVTGLLPSFSGLIFSTLIMSFGFHYFDTTCDSLTLQYFAEEQSPWVFGKLGSLASLTNIGVGVLIFSFSPFLSYAQLYLLIGGMITMAGIWGMTQNPASTNLPPQRKKMVLRKKYWLFYFLTFMAGARRQIFMAFAVFLLVRNFDFSVREITILFVINNALIFFLYPLIGRSIIRFGERKVLSLEYASLIVIFLAYATVHSKMVVALLYVLDQVFYNFHIAIQTYFQKIADPGDIASSISVSFTINHIAAVVLPAIGGVLWMIDYRIPFVCGAVFSLISLMAVQIIKIKKNV
ncbi:MAG: MFS transporter [Deltaproteobacteria bacterium]|nr:MFS transporter [Deltaproteobacteria bacterium]MBW2633947.1 MFS transporter [Deltaproteobacteria bacterium]MBW2676721.1 MFS transporter [Deltaproteobacteria bacterium]